MSTIRRSETVYPLIARMVGVFFILGILSYAALSPDARGEEPQPPFNVGYQALDLNYQKDGQDQTLTVAVWYPTTAQPKLYNYGGPTSGRVAGDAAPR